MIKNDYLPCNSMQTLQPKTPSSIYNAFWSLLLLFGLFTVGCSKTATSGDATSPNSNSLNGSNSQLAGCVTVPLGPGAVNLGTSNNFTILAKTGISTTGTTSILGDIGVSPIGAPAITGFGLIMATDNQSSHTPIVTGNVYAANYTAPTPAKMTTAISDMQTAFTTANGLSTNAIVNLYAGDISGRTLLPGLYKWTSGVLITGAGVTLSGGPNDTWVFQVAQNLTVSNSATITLIGGAQVKNITWVVSGQATLGTYSNFKGNILSQTLISVNTGAKVTGKLLAQTAVTLIADAIIPN